MGSCKECGNYEPNLEVCSFCQKTDDEVDVSDCPLCRQNVCEECGVIQEEDLWGSDFWGHVKMGESDIICNNCFPLVSYIIQNIESIKKKYKDNLVRLSNDWNAIEKQIRKEHKHS